MRSFGLFELTVNNTLPACPGTFITTMGLPCAHLTQQRMQAGLPLRVEDFHIQWRLDRLSKLPPMNPLALVREPLRILGKGQKRKSLKRDKSKFERVDLAIQAMMELERSKERQRQVQGTRKRQQANSKLSVSEPVSESTIELMSEPAIKTTSEPAIEPAIEPASEPAIGPMNEPATEPMSSPANEPVSSPAIEPPTKKPKQDWRIPTKEEEEEEEAYERFLTAFMDKHGRLPSSVDEDPQIAEFGGYLPGLRRLRR
jgi:hypothetical protein